MRPPQQTWFFYPDTIALKTTKITKVNTGLVAHSFRLIFPPLLLASIISMKSPQF